MFRAVTVLALMSAAALAAPPVPPPTEKELLAKYWRKTAGVGEFEPKGAQLTLRSTSGKPDIYAWSAERDAVPRTARPARGDFEATVRVLDAAPPRKGAEKDSGWAGAHAGLYVQGAGHLVRYHLTQTCRRLPGGAEPELARGLGIEVFGPNGAASGDVKEGGKDKARYLRLARVGTALTVSSSADGEKWSEPADPFATLIKIDLPDEVTVGVFYAHSASQFGHATFDTFTVENPAARRAEK